MIFKLCVRPRKDSGANYAVHTRTLVIYANLSVMNSANLCKMLNCV